MGKRVIENTTKQTFGLGSDINLVPGKNHVEDRAWAKWGENPTVKRMLAAEMLLDRTPAEEKASASVTTEEAPKATRGRGKKAEEPEAKAETKPEAKAETKPEAKAETKPEAKAETQAALPLEASTP